MKVSHLSLKKISWLFHHPGFKKKPVRTLVRVLRWELIRFRGKPVSFIYDKTLPILLFPNDGIARLVFYFDYHEPTEFSFLNDYLEKDMICLDVGANIGMYSLFMAKRSNQVIAFEPQVEAMSRLKSSITANGLSNITIVPKAISNQACKLALSLVGGDSAKTYTTMANSSKENQYLVDAISLDAFFQENPISRLDYLKIDVEGSEPDVLIGAQITIKEFRPLIQIEIVSAFQNRSEAFDFDFNEYFTNIGYELCYIDERTNTLRRGNSWNTIAVPTETLGRMKSRGLLTA
jgi:FkbM family methyltransferase